MYFQVATLNRGARKILGAKYAIFSVFRHILAQKSKKYQVCRLVPGDFGSSNGHSNPLYESLGSPPRALVGALQPPDYKVFGALSGYWEHNFVAMS